MFYLFDTIRQSVDFMTLSQKVGYQVSKFHVPDVWKDTEGEGINVAILDTGCDCQHADLRACNGSYTCIPRLKKPGSGNAGVADGDGHGTHVSGIIAARNNTIGIVGLAPKCNIFPIKVLDDSGSGSIEWVVEGLNRVLQGRKNKKFDVVNMSLGSTEGDPRLRKALQRLYEAGIPVVCAAGNAGTKQLDYPARYPETIAVGAVDENNLKASFSQMGPNLDFMAPGVSILSTVPNNRYMIMSGTSMATPWITGVIALMIAKHRKHGGDTPINSVEDVRDHLKKACIDMKQAGRDQATGFGLIDVPKIWKESVLPTLTLEERVEILESKVQKLEKMA